jgi:hypothetical protein
MVMPPFFLLQKYNIPFFWKTVKVLIDKNKPIFRHILRKASLSVCEYLGLAGIGIVLLEYICVVVYFGRIDFCKIPE